MVDSGQFIHVDSGGYVTLPLSSSPIQVLVTDMAENNDPLCIGTTNYAKGRFAVYGDRIKTTNPNPRLWGHWIAICK